MTHEDIDIDGLTQTIVDRTRQWLSLRVRPSASKGKQKESTSGVPQSRGYKEYSRKMRSNSRKNTSTNPNETVEPEENTHELLEKVKEQMRRFELLKKATDYGVREGLGVVPLVEVHPVRTTMGKTLGKGTQEEDEQGKSYESTQTPPPNMIGASTQPPSTATTQAPILTLATITPMPLPTDTTTMPPMIHV